MTFFPETGGIADGGVLVVAQRSIAEIVRAMRCGDPYGVASLHDGAMPPIDLANAPECAGPKGDVSARK